MLVKAKRGPPLERSRGGAGPLPCLSPPNAAIFSGANPNQLDARRLPGQGAVDRLAYAEALSRKAGDLQPTLATWTSWWRDVLLAQHGCSAHVINIDLVAEIGEAARHYAAGDVRGFLARLEQAPDQLNRNVNSRLLLETLLLHMPAPAA